MYNQPNHVQNVSLALSEVLSDIGVNETILLKRRRKMLLQESISTTVSQLDDTNSCEYYFGSKSEGTTTPGLNSDIDTLRCYNQYNIIQNLSEWEPGKSNYMMIQDETVSPGYCLLQRLRKRAPLPYDGKLPANHFRDKMGRILLKNSLFHTVTGERFERHGPAFAQQGKPGLSDIDVVSAFPCKSWPLQARKWLRLQGEGQWPTDEMKRYCSTSGCFVVAVASRGSENEELEWRISTSLAERCLMFNLNITQIQCYVLMKMVLKTYLKPKFGDTISSFMCKTVLFHCIADTNPSVWRENNLLVCLSLCLSLLYLCVSKENCPHFIIPQNNLMKGHISTEIKPQILEILNDIVVSNGRALLEIECNVLGKRLDLKLNVTPGVYRDLLQSLGLSEFISGRLFYDLYDSMNTLLNSCSFEISQRNPGKVQQTFLTYISQIVNKFFKSRGIDRIACSLLAPWFCTSHGSVLASLNIGLHNTIPQQAFTWISLGLNSDVSSSRLKLVSILYCIGKIQKTENELADIEKRYDRNIVEPVSRCYEFFQHKFRKGFLEVSARQNEEAIQHVIAFPVIFLPTEINCVLKEMRYEMFRSTKEDLTLRDENDYWMDWAVVDSLSFLYFLQFKTFRQQEDKQRALSNLVQTINYEPNLGHVETALNLLGQCMEQENRGFDAIKYYLLSLKLRERNNAAKIHICRLLSTMINCR
ncbi:uncharacterized protein LOC123530603 [Mercenaria mercenaria]|uniref:uncharacterized protein LOC123530603 n=1 Tax=Mercenaria mercenaria TaxID=6596 RepID=UPI00234ED42A|nr:uncharacterized protein LOC123530603 [Mercenaria mercenaria]